MDYEYYKLEIFVPVAHLEDIREVLAEADAGHIGNYDSCLSYSRVKGTWRPLQGASPYIGEEGAVSEADELKVEVNVRKDKLASTLQSIRSVHPYEEPVINVIPLYGAGKKTDGRDRRNIRVTENAQCQVL